MNLEKLLDIPCYHWCDLEDFARDFARLPNLDFEKHGLKAVSLLLDLVFIRPVDA
jgi:hypothetical protein